MKRTFSLLAAFALLFISQTTFAQRAAPSPTATVKQMIGTTEMELVYSRPSLDGRPVSRLTPNGKVWRTGANANTKISFNKDVTIGGKALAAGKYSMYSIPGENEWTIIINSNVTNWGTQYSESEDVIRFTAPVTKTSNSVETFVINMTDYDKNSKDKANIELAWGELSIKFEVKVNN